MTNEDQPGPAPGEGGASPEEKRDPSSPLEPDMEWLSELDLDLKQGSGESAGQKPPVDFDDFLELEDFKTEAPAAPLGGPAAGEVTGEFGFEPTFETEAVAGSPSVSEAAAASVPPAAEEPAGIDALFEEPAPAPAAEEPAGIDALFEEPAPATTASSEPEVDPSDWLTDAVSAGPSAAEPVAEIEEEAMLVDPLEEHAAEPEVVSAADESRLLLDLPEDAKSSEPDEPLVLDLPEDAGVKDEPLVLDLPDDARGSGEEVPPVVTERPAPEKKEAPKPAPNRRVAMVAALLAAASVPSAGVYFSQQSTLKQLQAARQQAEADADKAKADISKAQADAKAAVDLRGELQASLKTAAAARAKAEADLKKAEGDVQAASENLAALNKKAETEASARQEALDQLKAARAQVEALTKGSPAPAVAAAASPVTPELIRQAVQDFRVPEKAQAAFSQFAAKAIEGKDASAPDKLIAALGESLNDPAQIDKLIADCDKSIASATSGPQKSRLIQVKTRLVRAKIAASKGAGRGAFLPPPSSSHGGRPMVLRVAYQAPAEIPLSAEETQLLEAARQATEADPENAAAFVDLGVEQSNIGRDRKQKGQDTAAIRFLDEALASFQKAAELLKRSPGSDVSGTVALNLASNIEQAARERLAITVVAAPAPAPNAPNAPNPLQPQLDAARAALAQADERKKAAEEKLARAEADRKTAETRANELNTALGTANQQAATAKESAAKSEQQAKGLQARVDELAALLKKAGGPGSGPGSVKPEPGTLPRYELAVASYIQGIQRMRAGDLSGAEMKFTDAIGWYAEDARFYYHRALARYLAAGGVGDPIDAAQDIRVGAWLEQMNQPPTHVVGKDLVHVQNGLRDWLESRRQAQRLLMSAGGPAAPVPAGAAAASAPAWVDSLKPELQ